MVSVDLDDHTQPRVAFDPAWNTHNDPLARADHAKIKVLIASLESDLGRGNSASRADDSDLLTSLDANIDIVKHSSASGDLHHCLTSLRTAIAPHRRLPDDVLIIILTLCFPTAIKVPLPLAWRHPKWAIPYPRPTTAPWNLLAVCTRWRCLLLGAPTLWCNLIFPLKRMDHYSRHAGLFHLLLARSGDSVPIALNVQVEDCFSPWTGDAAARLVKDLVEPYARRLKELRLALPSALLDSLLVKQPCAMAFDQLECVVLEYPIRDLTEGSPLRGVFRNAPRLRRFSIHGRLPSYTLELPWDQLEELHLVHTLSSAEGSHRILKNCTRLVSCTVSFHEDTLPAHDSAQSITTTTMPHLTSLTLDCTPLAPFLMQLCLPSLTTLTFQSDIDLHTCETVLLPFLQRAPPLTHLTLAWWVPPDAIRTLLRATPHLTHLHFVPGRTAEVFKLLWAVDLAPRLECLTFVCYPNVWEEVVEILGLRGLTGRLREVHVGTFFRKDVDIWKRDPRLRTLREIGMRLDITNIVEGRYS